MLLQDFNLEYQNVSKTLQVPKHVATGFQPGVSKRIKNTARIRISTWSIKTYQKLAVSKHVVAGFQPGVSKRIKNTVRIKKISKNDPLYQKKQKNVSKRIKTYQKLTYQNVSIRIKKSVAKQVMLAIASDFMVCFDRPEMLNKQSGA